MGGYGAEGIECLNTNTNKFTDLNTRRYFGRTTNVFIRDKAGRYWFGNWDGLGLFDHEINFLGAYLPDNNDPFSLSAKKITSMIQDKNGVVWMGTEGGGVNYFYPFSEK